jgi:L-lactate dehydrogenase
MVGSAAGFALILKGIAKELVLVDIDEARARAEAEDIAHAVPFAAPAMVRHGGYADIAGAGVVILACGVSQKPGESRLALLERNAEVFRIVVGEVMAVCPDAVLLVASNPVDIMGQITQRHLGPAAGARDRVGHDPRHRAVPLASGATPRHLAEFGPCLRAGRTRRFGGSGLVERAGGLGAADGLRSAGGLGADGGCAGADRQGRRNAAYTIIEGKGATWYGIGGGLARIVGAIAGDEQAVLSVSTVEPDVLGVSDVALSLPRLVGRGGVSATLWPDLDPDETEKLRASAEILKTFVRRAGL